MFGFWFGWFEWASQNANLGVCHLFGHLAMGEVSVKHNTLDELTVFNGSSRLGNDFNQIKVDISSLKVSDSQDSFDSQISKLFLALGHYFGAQSSFSTLPKILVVMLLNINLLLNLVQSCHCNIAGLFKSVSNLQGVKTFVQ